MLCADLSLKAANASMVVIQKLCALLCLKSAYYHAHTALHCSHAVKRRHWLFQHWELARMNRSWTHSRVNIENASCCTITFRHILSVKRVAWALRVAVRLVTVNWHGVPFARFCLPLRTSLIQSAPCPRLPNPMVHRLWQPFVERPCP